MLLRSPLSSKEGSEEVARSFFCGGVYSKGVRVYVVRASSRRQAHSPLQLAFAPLRCALSRRERLEIRKIEGLTFRLMPEEVLIRTLSFGSEEDEWLNVCKDWLEALSPSLAADDEEPGSSHE